MTKLRFYEKSHTYWYGKKKLESVTTFVHHFFEPFDGKKIARFLAMLNKKRGIKGKGVRYYLKEWKESAAHGTRVHEAIEKFIRNEDIPKLDERDSAKYKAGVDTYHSVVKKLVEPVEFPELKIYDIELGLAGTIDLCIQHNKKDKRVITLVDWKTSKKISMEGYKGKKGIKESTKDMEDCHLVKYGLQLSFYAYMLERQHFTIDKLYICHLLPDSSYNMIEVDYMKYKVIEMIKEMKNEYEDK